MASHLDLAYDGSFRRIRDYSLLDDFQESGLFTMACFTNGHSDGQARSYLGNSIYRLGACTKNAGLIFAIASCANRTFVHSI